MKSAYLYLLMPKYIHELTKFLAQLLTYKKQRAFSSKLESLSSLYFTIRLQRRMKNMTKISYICQF